MAVVGVVMYARGWRAYELCWCKCPAWLYRTAETPEQEEYFCEDHVPEDARGKFLQ